MRRLDPITFEVLKHRLWQINDEQGSTIRTISTSPIVVEGNDMNAAIFTRAGELVTAGPYVVTHVTTMEGVIKNVMALADEVHDGDAYLVNDPYLGALHQNDVAVVSPVFHEGEIALWVGNVLHHADLAGLDEGSFCINARNVFQEAPRYFLKLVDRGRLSREVERTFTTNSRLPNAVALDLRAQVGAINVAKQRLADLLAKHGAETILAVVEEAIDDAERRFRARLRELPEGVWLTEVYMDGDRVGSDRIVTVRLRLEKRGEELIFDYEGTDPQVEGAVNATASSSYAGTVAPLYCFLYGGDIDWNSSIRRCVTVRAPEGSVMAAKYPAALSIGSIGFTWLAGAASLQVVAQMLSESQAYRDRVCSSWSPSCNGVNIFGFDHRNRYVGALLSDHRAGGAAGRSFADGFSHTGQLFSCLSFISNVESQELKLPLLYLYRRHLPDSGGPGMFRGGMTAAAAVVPYRGRNLVWKAQNTAGADQSNAAGIHGGYPGAGSMVSVVTGTEVWERLRRGESLRSYEDFGGAVRHLPSKSEGPLGPDDVLVLYPPAGGGYGDPLLRDAERVLRDVSDGSVTEEGARRHYGVILGPTGEVDLAATAEERRRRFAERREWTAPASRLVPSPVRGEPRSVGPQLDVVPTDAGPRVACHRCGYQYCAEGEDPRRGACRHEAPLRDAGPWLALAWGGESPNFRLQEWACPGCGVLIDVRERRVLTEDSASAGSVVAATSGVS